MKRFLLILSLLIVASVFVACGDDHDHNNYSGYEVHEELSPSTGRIFMFGERHGNQTTMRRQLEIWGEFYHNNGMRHLFVELPYFAAEFLNIWMQAEDDTILLELFEDWRGTSLHVPYTLDFYRTIKADFPETIFHGTDVGHAADSTGQRFLRHLRDNGLTDGEQYRITNENIAQFRHFDSVGDHTLRSSVYKPQNFTREFDRLGNQDIMAIHGAGHVHFGYFDGRVGMPTLAYALQQRYGDNIEIFDMTRYALVAEPQQIDIITINNTDFSAPFFGRRYINFTTADGRLILWREFWRLEEAYPHFADSPLTGNVLPFTNFPFVAEVGQVFVVDYGYSDGTTERQYLRASGEYWQNMPVAQEFLP